MGAVDTIVAVSTPVGRSPRAVIRLSGPAALSCVRLRFRADGGDAGWEGSFRAARGTLALLGQAVRVPAVLYVMRAPHSYTREDVAEAHLPGSPALLDLVLDDLLAHGPAGLRLAEPGEFTRRAFLNGRIDLSQAEAVLALIRARSGGELVAAASKLRGGVSRRCAQLQERVAGLRAQVEAALDFAPHGIEIISEEDFLGQCRRLRREMQDEAAAGRAELATNGCVHAVICGPPNAGKSSLLNRLAGGEAAIVHHAAGTTRDPVRAEVELDGARFRLTDTAGLTAHADGPDAEAVRLARERVESCQLLILVLDGAAPLPEGALDVAATLPPARTLCVINKSDLPQAWDEAGLADGGLDCDALHTSALTGDGLDRLREALWRTVAEGRLDASAADCLFNARQRSALRRAAREVAAAEGAVRDGVGYEFAAFNLREAGEALGEVTGGVTAQGVLDRIFSQFCIGK